MAEKKRNLCQNNLLAFFNKKPKHTNINADSLEPKDTTSTSNTEDVNDDIKIIDEGNYSTQPSSHSKYDIGLYVKSTSNVSDEEKIDILRHVWIPDAKYNFPTTDNGKFKRSFQLKWLDVFQWLAYSKIKEGCFCKFCVLFLHSHNVGKGSNNSVGTLVVKPYTNLKNALEIFRDHEKTSYHQRAFQTAENLMSIFDKNKNSIIIQLNTQQAKDILMNREKLKPIIQTIRLCGRQQIAIRGHEDWARISMNEPEKNDGNFRSLLRCRVNSGDTILKEHLETSSSRELYTSPIIQNEIISIFGELIKSHLVNGISKSEFYTVLADETTDITQIEQLSLCIRYFDETLMKIREDFLTFIPVHDVSGLGLATTIKDTLENLGLDLTKLRGQGYDGAAAMRASFRGVQAIIKEKYPKALYTQCVSHALNLCLSDASKIQEIQNAFGVISECCSFFNCSAKRTTALKNKILEMKPTVHTIKLKTLCETRWVLRHESVLIFKEFLDPIVAAIEQLQTDGTRGTASLTRTNSILNCICNFSFIVAVTISSKLLGYTLSQYLQSKNMDLVTAIDRIKAITSTFQEMRENCTEVFSEVYTEAKSIATLLNIEEKKPRLCVNQKNRSNIPHCSTEEYFKRTIFIPYLDDLISSLNDRFMPHKETIISLQQVLPSFCFNSNFSSIKAAVNFYIDDLPGYMNSIEAEYDLWIIKWKSVEQSSRPTNSIDALISCDKVLYPNIRILLKILAILPVSTASAERSFSTLRRLKTYLRNSTSENRLVGLALLNVHRDISISDENVLNKFANSGRARRLQLII